MRIGRYDVGLQDEKMVTREFNREKNLLVPDVDNPQSKNYVLPKSREPLPEHRKEVDINKIFYQEEPVDTSGYYKRAKSLMEDNANKDFVDRAINNQDAPILGNSTHRMAYGGPEEDGEYFIYPEIIRQRDEDGLVELDKEEARKYAKDNDEYINVGKDPYFAQYMSEVGYKYAFPQEDYEEALNNYVENWQYGNNSIK